MRIKGIIVLGLFSLHGCFYQVAEFNEVPYEESCPNVIQQMSFFDYPDDFKAIYVKSNSTENPYHLPFVSTD